jgi:xanthine dehydrogenase YagR molybdenum-binding subunit
MHDGRLLVGWGMATACYPVHRLPCRAVIRIDPDGKLTVLCGTQDMGTGAYTVLAQLAANGVGVPVSIVVVELGDTTLPEAPYSGGSMSTASFTPAVESAAGSLRAELIALAVADADSPLYQADPAGVTIEAGQVREIGGNRAERLADLVGRRGQTLEAGGHADLDAEQQVSSNGYGAVFVEVRVDADLGEIRVSRVTAAYAAGRILNRKLAHSQYLGGLVMGIGMALHEETLMDHTLHRVVGDNLADYVIPVCADMPEFDIHLVDEADPHLPGGVKGIGMLGTVGTAGAIANAIYHATGVRLRRLPLRLNA